MNIAIASAKKKDNRLTQEVSSLLFIGAFGLTFLVQFVLVFTKSINWDEFLHFSQIYDLANGRLRLDLQVLHVHLFAWAPSVSSDVITQIQASRLVMLLCEIFAAGMIVRLAVRFVDRETALLSGLVYVTAGYVFMHAFSFRPDAMAAATLMLALTLLAELRLQLFSVLAVGALVGIAGMMTTKSILYLPCFAGMAWYRLSTDGTHFRKNLLSLAGIPLVAIGVFYALFQIHRTGLPLAPSSTGTITTNYKPFLESGLFARWKYTLLQACLAPVVTFGIFAAPFAWRKRDRNEAILLAGLFAPLLSLIFYRNTFPYFFVFLLPPICVAIAPVLEGLRLRYGNLKLIALAMVTPVILICIEPFGVVARQRAIIDEVHRLFPTPTGYLAYTSSIPDYPRILRHLVSGVGLQGYYAGGTARIAEQINQGKVGFVLADCSPIEAGLRGKSIPQSFHPADVAALRDNFIRYAGLLWLAGKIICPKQEEQTIVIVRAGPHALDGGSAIIDGRHLESGQTIELARGLHKISYTGVECLKLWGMPEIPRPPSTVSDAPIMTGF